VATEIITLPGHLRVLFDKIYEGEPVSGNAWVVWQRVLQARIQEPAFFRRLSTLQLACRMLRQEVDTFPVGAANITSRTKTSWIQAIDQLTSLTMPNDFHLSIPQWKEKAQQSDITLLDTMHVYYNLHNMFVELPVDQVKDLVARLNSLIEGVNTSKLDGSVKRVFVRSLGEVKFSLENVEVFGFESAWSEGASLVAAVLRFRNELASSPDWQNTVSETSSQIIQFLAERAVAKQDGGVPLADAVQALLGRAPPA
jgi:hypothetical protein